MSGWQRMLSGSLMAALSSLLLIGSILISYVENGYALALPALLTQTVTAISFNLRESEPAYQNKTTPLEPPTATPTFTPNPGCLPPAGYVAYVIQPGDTLASLARRFASSEAAIAGASCFETSGLSSISLVAGTVLYVPEVRPTRAVTQCSGAPAGWAYYIVKPGDTLFSLSLVLRVTVAQLQSANCKGNSAYLRAGEVLRVPFIPYSQPSNTAVAPPIATLPIAPPGAPTGFPPAPPIWSPPPTVEVIQTTPPGEPVSSEAPIVSDTVEPAPPVDTPGSETGVSPETQPASIPPIGEPPATEPQDSEPSLPETQAGSR